MDDYQAGSPTIKRKNSNNEDIAMLGSVVGHDAGPTSGEATNADFSRTFALNDGSVDYD